MRWSIMLSHYVRRMLAVFLVVLLMVISVTGCGKSKDNSSDKASGSSSGSDKSIGAFTESPPELGTLPGEAVTSDSVGKSVEFSKSRAGGTDVAASDDSGRTDAGGTETTAEFAADESVAASGSIEVLPEKPSQTDMPEIKSGQLTAGEWSDLKNWSFWTNLLNNQEWSDYQNRWQIYPIKRITVTARDGEKLVCDALVSLKDKDGKTIWTARTDNKGQAELFINMFTKDGTDVHSIIVEANGQNKTAVNDQKQFGAAVDVDLSSGYQKSDILDMMLVVDTTGSMSDELEYLKTELKSVAEKVKSSNDNKVSIRVSANFYRDHGDEYLVRPFPFTTNIDEVVNQISSQSANGGGDFEEAVEEALNDAINNHSWSDRAKARLMFLVLDAPPHYTDEIREKLHKLTSEAAAKGIRIIPIASSGIDKNTEFLLRYLSVSTGGTYVFLTDHSGIGGSHIEPTIGQYQVELLNDALVRIVNSYLE